MGQITLNQWNKINMGLRRKILRHDRDGRREYLLANFEGTLQAEDIKQDSPEVREKDFFRIKTNVQRWDPNNSNPVDFRYSARVMDSMKSEFDIPYWGFHAMMGNHLTSYNDAFTFQLKACNLYCPWCFGDDKNKNGRVGNGKYFSGMGMVDAFERERESKKNEDRYSLNMIRSSGGEPTIAIEQWIDVLREFERDGRSDDLVDKVCLWADTNLTTGHFIDYLEQENLTERNIREKIGEYSNPQVLCSFKGTDVESFLRATGFVKRGKGGKVLLDNDGMMIPNMKFAPLYEERWHSFGKLVDAGIDVYPFIYDSDPETVGSFMEEGAKRFGEQFYAKTWGFKLGAYGPFKDRYERMGLDPEKEDARLQANFLKTERKLKGIMLDKFGIPYKMVPRSGIMLKSR
ncbi:hypothetical protein HNV12_03030 [Methanococcoides sp. SA1]|nr:hypothetical protein [Methanococcoides sp. SA1]